MDLGSDACGPLMVGIVVSITAAATINVAVDKEASTVASEVVIVNSLAKLLVATARAAAAKLVAGVAFKVDKATVSRLAFEVRLVTCTAKVTASAFGLVVGTGVGINWSGLGDSGLVVASTAVADNLAAILVAYDCILVKLKIPSAPQVHNF